MGTFFWLLLYKFLAKYYVTSVLSCVLSATSSILSSPSLLGPQVMLVESRYTGQQYIFKVLHKSLKAMAAIPRGVSKVTKNRAPVSEKEIV